MPDILLVNPFNFKSKNLGFSIGVLSLATELNKKDYNSEIVDLNYAYTIGDINIKNNESDFKTVGDYLLEKNPKVIGFSCMCNNYHFALKVSKYIKKVHKDIKIFLGGPQSSLTAKDTLMAFDFIDLIAIGESEKNIGKIIDFLLNDGISPKNIKGIAYRENGQVVINERGDIVRNLNELPYLNYSLVNYFDKVDVVDIETSRGCPFSCTYCSNQTFWKTNARIKDINRVVNEITYLKEKYNKTKFCFVHDLFTVNRGYLTNFCNELIKNNIKIEWSCSARIDTLDLEILELMNKSGCKNLSLGIESGSRRIQKLINKNLKLDNLPHVLDNILKLNFNNVTFSFIYNFPKEKMEDLRDTLKLIRKINTYKKFNICISKCMLLPQTTMYDNNKSNLGFVNNFSSTYGDIDVSYCNDIIVNNIDIFPQYHNLISEHHKYFSDIDKFISIYLILQDLIPDTLNEIESHFNYDLLDLYISIKSYNSSFFNNIYSSNNIKEQALKDIKLYMVKNF